MIEFCKGQGYVIDFFLLEQCGNYFNMRKYEIRLFQYTS